MSVKRRSRHVVAASVLALVAMGLIAIRITAHRAPQKPAGELADLREEDDEAFHQVQRRIDSGEAGALGPELEEIDRIVRENPHHLDSHLLAIRIALKLYQSARAPMYLAQTVDLVHRAKALAPHNPDLLGLELQVALENDPPHAADVLGELTKLLPPDDSRVLSAQASLLEREGQWQEARLDLMKAIDKNPAWQIRMKLAQLESSHGFAKEARDLLNEVRSEFPQNLWAKEALGDIELSYGDPAVAERLFLELSQSSQRRNPLTNLGQAQFLLGHYDDAAKTYQIALKLSPYHPTVLLDLADAEMELNQVNDALHNYRQALEKIQEIERSRKAKTSELLIKAQCLARLGDYPKAEKATGEALRRSPGSPGVQSQAALVFSLSGNRTAALQNLKAALQGGIQKHWFRGSAFRPLADDPEYQRLIGSN